MKRQNPLQKAYRRIETEGKKHSICRYSACGAVAGVAVLCWIAVKDEYALRIEWYKKGGLIENDE